ncbi:hypothetical protein M3Y98_00890400 [Aphelenchoides besseyi]|nr:hypothetical protein M3Y98_00890400 [Aphelenchoides besseyi]
MTLNAMIKKFGDGNSLVASDEHVAANLNVVEKIASADNAATFQKIVVDIFGILAKKIVVLLAAARLAKNAVIFVAYDYSRMIVALTSDTTDRNRLSPLQSALTGGMTSAFAVFTRCPTELIKCEIQTMHELHPKNHSGALRLCRELIRKEGFNGLFTGYTATLLRQSLGNSILFGVYETAREFARREGERRDQIGISRTMFCGGLSGFVYWTSIYPIDVLKSRIQVYGSGTLLTTLLHLIREDGISALFKGFFLTVLHFERCFITDLREHQRVVLPC